VDREPEQTKVVSNGETNRELTTLKRMFTLAIQAGKLLHKPYIPLLREDNVRKGFFEPDQLNEVLRRLPSPLRPVITFAYLTGSPVERHPDSGRGRREKSSRRRGLP
jgi:hypothetical protein